MRTLQAFLFAAAVAACTGSGDVRYSAQADVYTPQLVEVEPGVRVVADYDQPVFFNDGYYWRYEGGTWYRSPYYNRSWIRVEAPPVAVRRIQRPERFVHYRVDRDRRDARPVIRDRDDTQVRRDERRIDDRRDDRKIEQENREIRHDQGEMQHDQKELDHDRNEIQRDRARGDQRELARDQNELRRDQREQAKDKKELDKDQRRRGKDARKDRDKDRDRD